MGTGIAQVFATHGYQVILFDVNREMLHKSQSRLNSDLSNLVTKNRITHEEKAATLSLIRFTEKIEQCIADVVIEAILEDKEAKAELINKLFVINGAETIIVTNTSSISVTAIAETLNAKGRFAGMHFFNPPTIMKLVEVVETPYTQESTIRFITSLCENIDKSPVLCADSPGFIVNRVARPYYLEALRLLDKNYADVQSIDQLLESTGFKMGPFRLMDLIGNDINYAVSKIVYESLGKPERLRPSPIQEEKVSQGLLGKKTGKGYYEYPA